MVLERVGKNVYHPKKKRTITLYRMKVYSYGHIDPVEKIAELSGVSLSEATKVLKMAGIVYETLLLKGYTIHVGDILKMSLYANCKSFEEEDQWMAMKESIKEVRLKVTTTRHFKYLVRQELEKAEYKK